MIPDTPTDRTSAWQRILLTDHEQSSSARTAMPTGRRRPSRVSVAPRLGKDVRVNVIRPRFRDLFTEVQMCDLWRFLLVDARTAGSSSDGAFFSHGLGKAPQRTRAAGQDELSRVPLPMAPGPRLRPHVACPTYASSASPTRAIEHSSSVSCATWGLLRESFPRRGIRWSLQLKL